MEYKKISYEIEDVIMTPELAKEYLLMNKKNRKKRQRKVNQYADEMLNGEWDIASDGVIITVYDGILKNGQHRLEAIVESGVTVPMIIYKPSTEPIVFDRGATRKAEDTINCAGGIEGKMVNRNMSAVVQLMWELGKDTGFSNMPDSFARSYLEKHYDMISDAVSLTSSRVRYLKCSASAAAIYCALRSGVDKSVIQRFVSIVNSGMYDNKKETSAIVLRNMFIKMEGNQHNTGRGGREYKFKIVQRALVDFSSKKERKIEYKENDVLCTYYSDYVFSQDFGRKPKMQKNENTSLSVSLDYKKILAEFVTNCNYCDSLINALYDWVEYKIDKREKYTEKGLLQFIARTKKRISDYGEHKVENELRNAMANGWSGCYFD